MNFTINYMHKAKFTTVLHANSIKKGRFRVQSAIWMLMQYIFFL